MLHYTDGSRVIEKYDVNRKAKLQQLADLIRHMYVVAGVEAPSKKDRLKLAETLQYFILLAR